jgi:Na+-transporting NADH:ubiquinone oxidoreductase subunit NqrF
VVSATSGDSSTTNSGSFGDLNNASVTVTVPSGETDQLVVFFSAESACYGGTSIHGCRARIVLDGNELNPTGGETIDSNALCTDGTSTCTAKVYKTSDSRVGASMVRVSGNVTAGQHIVKVQYSTSAGETTLRLDKWSLVVQRIKVS